MAEAYPALTSLRTMLKAHREEFKEQMAAGRSEDKYWELVGQCKALAWMIEKVGAQIKNINGDSDEP